VIAFEGGEPDGTKSAARRMFPGQSTTISVDANQTNQTFFSQRRDKQLVIRFAISWLIIKSKNLFQYKSVKKQRRTKFPSEEKQVSRVDSRINVAEEARPPGQHCLTIPIAEESEELSQFDFNAFFKREGVQTAVLGLEPLPGGLGHVGAFPQSLTGVLGCSS